MSQKINSAGEAPMGDSTEKSHACLQFLYCGHGDTILVGSDGCWGLIDCHLTKSSGAETRIRRLIKEHGIRRLDFACLTHPDRDHYYGMRALLEECFCDADGVRLSEFWDAGMPYSLMMKLDAKLHRGRATITKGLRELYEGFVVPRAHRGQFVWRCCQQGFESCFGQFRLRTIGPTRNAVERWASRLLDGREPWGRADREESNDLSVVLVLSHRKLPVHFLLGGDATVRAWRAALTFWKTKSTEEREDVHFSAVKISHHGATSGHFRALYESFCRRHETYGVLSVGPHYDSHPAPQVIRDLTGLGIRVYATCWPESANHEFEKPPLPGLPADDEEMPPKPTGFESSDICVTLRNDGKVIAEPAKALLTLTEP